jgi:hypothetical protein
MKNKTIIATITAVFGFSFLVFAAATQTSTKEQTPHKKYLEKQSQIYDLKVKWQKLNEREKSLKQELGEVEIKKKEIEKKASELRQEAEVITLGSNYQGKAKMQIIEASPHFGEVLSKEIENFNLSKCGKAYKEGFWENYWIQRAYEISGCNKDFVRTLDMENSNWDYKRKSNLGYWRKGKLQYDYGFCQISEYYHPEIYNDERFFTDQEWQLEQCWKLYKGGTTFYGKSRRHLSKVRFTAI